MRASVPEPVREGIKDGRTEPAPTISARRGRGKSLSVHVTNLQDPGIRPLLQEGVMGMPGVLVGVVSRGVVAADEGPARVVAAIAVGAMEEVAVEEEGVAGLERTIDPLEASE